MQIFYDNPESKMSLTSRIGGTVVGIAICAGAYFGLIKPSIDHVRFQTAYENALVRYADTNKDGFISSVEQDAFDRELLKDKGVTLITGQMPKFKNGESVPRTTVTEWIENYRPVE